MEAFSSAVAVLTAMITPAVLISACGALILSTSTRLGLVAAVGRPSYAWLPVVLGLTGACGLFYGSVLLIRESFIAQEALNAEMDFIWKLGRALAPPDLRQTRSPHYNPLTLRRKL